jgi:nitrogen fixation protein FixH
MTDVQYIAILFTGLVTLMTGIILWRFKKSDEKAEKRAAIRIQADKLQQEGISVVGSLAYAAGRAVQTHDHEVELDNAMKCYTEYKSKKAEFTQQLQAQYTQGR